MPKNPGQERRGESMGSRHTAQITMTGTMFQVYKMRAQ